MTPDTKFDDTPDRSTGLLCFIMFGAWAVTVVCGLSIVAWVVYTSV